MSLIIRKYGNKNFQHEAPNYEDYGANDITIIFEGDIVKLRSFNGRVIFDREGYNYNNVLVANVNANPVSYNSVEELKEILINLGYPFGDVSSSDSSITNTSELINDGSDGVNPFLSINNLDDIISDDSDNSIVIGNDGGLFVPQGIPNSGSESLRYIFAAPTVPQEPTPNTLQINNVDPTLVTEIYFSTTAYPNRSVNNILELLQQGDALYLQQSNDDEHFINANITGAAVDNGTYFTVPIEIESAGIPFDINSFTNLVVYHSGGGAGGGGSQNLQQVTDVGNTTTNDIILQNGSSSNIVEIINDGEDGAIRLTGADGENIITYESNIIFFESIVTGKTFEIKFEGSSGSVRFPDANGYLPFYFTDGTSTVTADNDGFVDISSISGGGGTKIVDQGNGDGLILSNRDNSFYENVGLDAVDLSIATSSPNPYGASGDYSFASNLNNYASGLASIAMGLLSNATDRGAVAIGEDCEATGLNSVALGYQAEATDNRNIALSGKAIGGSSFAVRGTTNGIFSTAIGNQTTSNGDYSATFGQFLTANAFNEIVVGSYNELSTVNQPYDGLNINYDNVIFAIGNGSEEINRRNAITVLQNGKVGIGVTAFDANNPNPEKLQVIGNIRSDGVVANAYKSKVTTSTGVTGTYDIDYEDADTYDLTLTGATTLTESNVPTTGNSQTVVIFATGGSITLPSSGTNFTTGTYDGSKNNWIVIKYFNTKRIITITQAD